MTGNSNNAELGKIRWADAELQGVEIRYEDVCLRVKESDGSLRILRAEGYIGYRLVGFWDEVVVDRAEISLTHAGLAECVNSIRSRLGPEWPESGSLSRNSKSWFALSVHLSDGAVLEVFAAQLRVDSVG